VHTFKLPHTLHIGKPFNRSSNISNTLEFGIWYFASSSLDLVGFSNADFVGCGIDQKNTSGTCHFLGSSLVCWACWKQTTIAQSTTEAEYVVAAHKFFG
jgi:hypothetical protein